MMQIRTKMINTNLWQVMVEDKSYKVHAMTGFTAAEKAKELYTADHPVQEIVEEVKVEEEVTEEINEDESVDEISEEDLLEAIKENILEEIEANDEIDELTEEELLELSKETLRSYRKAAMADSAKDKRAANRSTKNAKASYSASVKARDVGWKQSEDKNKKKSTMYAKDAAGYGDRAAKRDANVALAKTKLKNA
jgi:hypothetical protein